jgi:hypothetical protein
MPANLERRPSPKALARLPPRDFKAEVLRCARALLGAAPEGFVHDDVAAVLGADFANGGASERRLRQCLTAMCAADVLHRVGWGKFAQGPAFDVDQPLGAGVALAEELHQAFISAGGIMTMPEILAEVAREDDGRARLVRRTLKETPRYRTGVPLQGFKRHWLLIESERVKMPLPGRWLLRDLQLTVARLGKGHVPWDWGLEADLMSYREAIALGLRRARELLDEQPEGILADPAIANALDWCLDYAASAGGGGTGAAAVGYGMALADWWPATRDSLGLVDALAYAWTLLEISDVSGPCVLDALDVRFWVAVGKRTNLDPAMLSRGAVIPDYSGDLIRIARPT